jgi:thioredoxin reductase
MIGPNTTPLGAFKRLCANSGMDGTMRSPDTHHLDENEESLQEFARKSGRTDEISGHSCGCGGGGAPARPSVKLFFDHCDHVCETTGVSEIHDHDSVTGVRKGRKGKGYTVETAHNGSYETANVILATGGSGMLRLPDWAVNMKKKNRPVYHLLDPETFIGELLWREKPGRIGIVGAGMTGTQAAISLANQGYDVRLFARRDLDVNEFDADRRYFDSDTLEDFRWNSYGGRVRIAHEVENPGSITEAVSDQFYEARRHKALALYTSGVIGAVWNDRSKDILVQVESGDSRSVDMLLLATGYSSNIFDSPLIDDCMETFDLFDHRWGNFPMLSDDCSWREGLYLSGPATVPVVGPFAPNIRGAHMVADRIYA